MSEWKLVPVEPTEMMFSATREQYWDAFQADYSAMLAAAPDAPQAEPVFYVHLDGIRAMPPDIFAAWSPTAKQTAHEYRPVFDHPPPDELARLRAENERLTAALVEAGKLLQGTPLDAIYAEADRLGCRLPSGDSPEGYSITLAQGKV